MIPVLERNPGASESDGKVDPPAVPVMALQMMRSEKLSVRQRKNKCRIFNVLFTLTYTHPYTHTHTQARTYVYFLYSSSVHGNKSEVRHAWLEKAKLLPVSKRKDHDWDGGATNAAAKHVKKEVRVKVHSAERGDLGRSSSSKHELRRQDSPDAGCEAHCCAGARSRSGIAAPKRFVRRKFVSNIFRVSCKPVMALHVAKLLLQRLPIWFSYMCVHQFKCTRAVVVRESPRRRVLGGSQNEIKQTAYTKPLVVYRSNATSFFSAVLHEHSCQLGYLWYAHGAIKQHNTKGTVLAFFKYLLLKQKQKNARKRSSTLPILLIQTLLLTLNGRRRKTIHFGMDETI